MAKRIDNAKRRVAREQRKAEQAAIEAEELENAETSSDEDAKFYEDATVLQEEIGKSQEFVEQNKKGILTVLGVVVAIVALFFAYKFYMGNQELAAQEELFPAVFYFEQDSLDKALNGDANSTNGLLAVIEEYGATDAGNLAGFYAGVVYLKKGEFDKAIEYLEGFSTDDFLWEARANALIGDAYMEKEAYGEAVGYYEKASSIEPNEQFTPMYMTKLALAQEMNNNPDKAKETLTKLLNKYPNYAEANNVKRSLGRMTK